MCLEMIAWCNSLDANFIAPLLVVYGTGLDPVEIGLFMTAF